MSFWEDSSRGFNERVLLPCQSLPSEPVLRLDSQHAYLCQLPVREDQRRGQGPQRFRLLHSFLMCDQPVPRLHGHLPVVPRRLRTLHQLQVHAFDNIPDPHRAGARGRVAGLCVLFGQ